MPDKFEERHLANLRRKERQIRKFYEQAIQQIKIGYSQIKWNGEIFRLKDYPQLLQRINNQIKALRVQLYAAVVNGIEESWALSYEKNNLLVDKRLAGKKPSKKGMQILYDPNKSALDEFIKRKEKGLNLSKRIWNTIANYRTEMETALGVGISEGRSANEMASDLQKYLKEPDRLFRKVRGDDGKLRLSKAARDYHPGQGVYRSSFQNALRVTASETNMSYRTADFERWNKLPFVTGVEVQLSKNHPEYDICDELKGTYPKDFLFRGWHPLCLCFATAKQMSDAEYDKLEDAILAGRPVPQARLISKPPAGLVKYVNQNAERIKGWKNKPYWIKDNPDYVSL